MRTLHIRLLVLALVALPATLAGCGGGGGGGSVPSAAYATLIYQTTASDRPDVFSVGEAGSSDVIAMALLDPLRVPTVDGTWTGSLRVVAVPLPDLGALTPDNPLTVALAVTRAGGLVSLSVSYLGQDIFRLDDLPLPVDGVADGVEVDGGDTWRYLARPWDEVQPDGLLGYWTALNFAQDTTLTVNAVDDAAISATIASRLHTGRRVGNSAYLVGSGTPDTVIILEDLGGSSARGYRTSGGGGDPSALDAFTLERSTPP